MRTERQCLKQQLKHFHSPDGTSLSDIIDVCQISTPPSGIKVYYSSCKGSRNSGVWCKTIIPIEE